MSDNGGWGQPPPPYGPPPPPGYGPPPPGYGPPPPGYGPPGYGPPPPYGAPGYGQPYGAPGYGPWNAPPPAPAPGGVPLRPLALGDILSGAFTLIRRNPAATLGITAIIQTVYGIAGAFISWAELNAARRLQTTIRLRPNSAQAATHALGHFFASFVPYLFLTFGLIFVFEAILTGMLTGALGRGLLGDKITIAEAWRLGRVGPVIAVSLLVPLILFGVWLPVIVVVIVLAVAHAGALAALVGVLGFIAALIVSIWIAVRLSLAVPAVVLENAGPVAAIKRSWELVLGSWWRIFGITLLAAIIVEVVAVVLQIPFAIVQSLLGGGSTFIPTFTTTAASPSLVAIIIGAVGGIVAATCTRPISAGVTVLLYTDMRIRKEGLDLALQQAGQRQALTGDEFASLWRPGRPPAWQSPGAGPTSPGAGWYPGQGPGGYGAGQGAPPG